MNKRQYTPVVPDSMTVSCQMTATIQTYGPVSILEMPTMRCFSDDKRRLASTVDVYKSRYMPPGPAVFDKLFSLPWVVLLTEDGAERLYSRGVDFVYEPDFDESPHLEVPVEHAASVLATLNGDDIRRRAVKLAYGLAFPVDATDTTLPLNLPFEWYADGRKFDVDGLLESSWGQPWCRAQRPYYQERTKQYGAHFIVQLSDEMWGEFARDMTFSALESAGADSGESVFLDFTEFLGELLASGRDPLGIDEFVRYQGWDYWGGSTPNWTPSCRW